MSDLDEVRPLPERAAYLLALLEECERLAEAYQLLMGRWRWWRPWQWPGIFWRCERNLHERGRLLTEMRGVMRHDPEVPL